MSEQIGLSTSIVAVAAAVEEAVREIMPIAQATLMQQGTHLPTAILHTMEGLVPIVLPFKNEAQKKALVAFVKTQALERHAFAATCVTCARVIDPRNGTEEEALVLATSVQGGRPYTVTIQFWRAADRSVAGFGDVVEGDDAAMPGQMMIFPDWSEETRH
jgi:hypothetical protein